MATADFVVKNGAIVNQNLTVKGNSTFENNLTLNANLIFEGSTADANETTITVVDPTTDNTITFPNASGTVVVSVSDTTTSTQGALNLDFTLSAAGNVSATGTAQGLSTTGTPSFSTVTSTVATGTSPFTVASTTKVVNLNADALDGLDESDFLRSNATDAYTSGTLTFNSGTTLTAASGSTVNFNNTTGTAPFTVASTTVVTNLNADLLDGLNTSSSDISGNSVVTRSSGNFSAGTITATIEPRTAQTTWRDHTISAFNDAAIRSRVNSEDNWIYCDQVNAQWGIYHRNIDSDLVVSGEETLPQNSIGFVGANSLTSYINLGNGNIFSKGNVTAKGNLAAWNTTTPGLGVGGLHLGAASATADAGPAITFGSRDSSSGTTAQAGIYVTSGGGFGTRMYLATTDAYASGSKVALSIGATGVVSIVRSTTSTSTTTGSLVVTGGVGISENLYVGGNMYITNTGPVLVLRDTDSTGANQIGYLSFQDNTSTERAWVGYGTTANDTFNIQNTYSGGFTFNGNTVWHSGNDGSGSGLDADLLDGISSGSFLRSDVATTWSASNGPLTVTTPAGLVGSNTGQVNTLQVFQATAGTDAFMTFHVGGDYAAHFGLDGTTNDLFYGGWSVGAVKNRVWHSGNDGSGSGLDADLLDGLELHTGRNNEANKVVRTDVSGYLQVGYINSNSGNEGNNSSPPRVWGTNGADDYLRTYLTSALSVGSAVSATTATNVSSPDGDRNAGTKLPNTNARNVRFDFANASTTGTGGNYAGVMTYAPWDGTTASTGDASYQLAFGSTAVNGGGIPKLNIRKGIDTTWNSWYTLIHSGNTERSTWNTYGNSIGLVAGELAWKNYGNGHTIFDASAGTAPNGTAVNNSTPQVAWTGTYPTLMGWNGANTYGVRVNVAERLIGTEINAGSVATTGTVTGQWTLVGASTFQATFADLAEWYDSDEDYEPGTVLVFGGTHEVTIASTANDHRVAGVVTTNPAFIMNVDRPGPSACVALQGKVPCKVIGQVNKGDLLVSSNVPGYAMANNNAGQYRVIGKAMENKTTEEQGTIYVSVGR